MFDGVSDWNYGGVTIHPCPPSDGLGIMVLNRTITKVKPDVVFVVASPGNMLQYTSDEGSGLFSLHDALGFEIIYYAPIEGLPIKHRFMEQFEQIAMRGKNILWTKRAQEAVGVDGYDYVHFGCDHAPFSKYDDSRRAVMKNAVGLDKRIVIGSVGVNKQTKGMADMIQLAAMLRREGFTSKDVVFYQHTNPYVPVMGGVDLYDLAIDYDVLDMFLWPPIHQFAGRHYYQGVKRKGTFVDDNIINNAEISGFDKADQINSFMHMSFIDRLNLLDAYLDLSYVEGWGMPLMEAMACGIPVMGVSDGFVRDELFGDARYIIRPTDEKYWRFWHAGGRLVLPDPYHTCKVVSKFLNMGDYLYKGTQGYDMVRERYSWESSTEKMIKLIEE